MSTHLRHAAALVAAAAVVLLLPARSEGRQVIPTAVASAATPAPAQAGATAEKQLEAARESITIKNTDVDLAVPESPAFTTLGLSPETIVRPATPREFGASLLNGLDRNGHLQTGVAIDTAPYLVFVGSHVSLKQYRTSRVTQILSRTLVSFATTKGATPEDKSVRLAAGVHATLYDSEDPRLNSDDLLECFTRIDVFRPAVLGTTPAALRQLEADRQNFETGLRTQSAACREQFQRKARWNGTSWIVAMASSGTSPTGLTSDLDGGALGFWTSVAYGFDSVPGLRNNAQVIGHARHLSNEVVIDEKLPGGQEVRDTTFAGARLRAGTNSFGLSFEAAYLRTAAPGRANDTAARLSFSAERRLAQNLWLTLAFGGDRGVDQGSDRGLSFLSAFKWGFAKDPTLTIDQLAKVSNR
jgi:hypothetical protein